MPGEDISVTVDIQNASRKEIASSYVAMTQVAKLFSDCFLDYIRPTNLCR